ncbi:uncharacterized protein LOC105435123 [Cucumis sativus]|uniref:Uncharacterized protein n=1 Tax=Cucumis sativus TaxID=3659 RepID=A0A0A0LD41_CUCSA|nr:uncharacterized protein LOC105435123 [Cucumis sativus]KGN58622.1 hypothetical protein Csa_002013 [Cucumis sativus]
MKASLIFREDQNLSFRAKIPLNFFGLPFRSSVHLPDSDNLSFTFATFFRSGPSFNLSYRPNQALNPFSLAIKAGIGLFGSPIDSPMTFAAEFNLPANQPPRFFLHFRPQLGDFTLRRSVQSNITNFKLPYRNLISQVDDDVSAFTRGKSVVGPETPDLGLGNPVLSSQRIDFSEALNRVDDVLSTMEINARSTFKVGDSTAVKFRWSMTFPTCMKKDEFTAKAPLSKMPYLALGKIKIERAAASESERESNKAAGAGEFSGLKKHLEDLWKESRWLKKNIEQLQSEIGEQKAAPSTPPVETRKKKGG